jgi:exopolysaccharide biosynthesis WecB/TagA/CpsF family protein
LTSIVGLLLALSGSAFAGFSLYLLTLAVAAAIPLRNSNRDIAGPSSRLAVLVPAHNEELLVGRCVESLLAQSYPRALYRVIVVADNCSDNTASSASAAGAEVLVRNQPESRGKGQALRYAMDLVMAAPTPPDAVVVVDADSIADPHLLTGLERELAQGHGIVQGDYTVIIEPDSPRSAMIAAGFLLFHRVRFSGRARIGMPANLVGNGMLLARSVLEAHPWDAFTGVEDLEYSMRLRVAGIRPRFARAAMVAGPGPATRAGVDRQRLRWEGGRFNVVRTWLWTLVEASIARRDPRLLDAALDLATPPLGLLCLATAGGALVVGAAVLVHLAPAWALIPWAVGVVALPAYVVIGLSAAGAPAAVWRVLLGAPRFLVWKLLTYVRLLRGFDSGRWDRSDRQSGQHAAVRIDIAGVPVDTVDMAAAISRLRAALAGKRLFHVSTINLDFVVRAQSDAELRRIFQRSDLNIADGAPVVWLGRLLGADLRSRVAGADLVPALLSEAAKAGSRVFLLGGEGGVAAVAGARIEELNPGIVVAGTYEPPRAAIRDMDNAEIIARIAEAKPDLLLVALGHPKQECWIDLHREQLTVSVAIGVGCVFDLIAGRSRRAPRWMQYAGLEWAYRAAREPRRLLGRYLSDAIWLVPITAGVVRSRLATRRLAEPA